MASLSPDADFVAFVQSQLSHVRYQTASKVVRAGLNVLDEHELAAQDRSHAIQAKLDEAWHDPRPSEAADAVFDRLEALHAAREKGA